MDLCNAGDLPYRVVGKHRRVSRHDIEALRTGSVRLTRDQLRSLWLAHAVAARLVENPDVVLSRARYNLERMLRSSARGSAKVWFQQWQALLDGPIEDVLEALTSRSPRSRELRQNTPFAGVLSEKQRRVVLAAFSRAVAVRPTEVQADEPFPRSNGHRLVGDKALDLSMNTADYVLGGQAEQ